jgi:putative addiction module component (TIGR02574 family)
MNLQQQILKLSIPERILMVENIWDSIAAENENIELTAAQKKELDRRLEKLEKGEGKFSTWEEVKARIQSKL